MSRIKDSDLLTTVEFARALEPVIREANARRHRSIHTSPLEKWRSSAGSAEPVSERHVALTLLRREGVTVVRAGVELNGITYQGKPTFGHVGDRLEAGWLATRPDFIELYDPARPAGEDWLGRLEPLTSASNKLSTAVKDARTYQIETVERAQRGADKLRSEAAAQLRGGVVDDLGAAPARTSRSRASRAAVPSSNRRRERIAKSHIWIAAKQ